MSKPLALLHYSNLIPGSQLGNRLIDMGYRVQTLPDLRSLSEICQKEKPLLVISEIVPSGPALGYVARLRKDAATQHIPVLGYSTAQDAAHQTEARAAGVTLLAGTTAIADHLARLLDQVLQIE